MIRLHGGVIPMKSLQFVQGCYHPLDFPAAAPRIVQDHPVHLHASVVPGWITCNLLQACLPFVHLLPLPLGHSISWILPLGFAVMCLGVHSYYFGEKPSIRRTIVEPNDAWIRTRNFVAVENKCLWAQLQHSRLNEREMAWPQRNCDLQEQDILTCWWRCWNQTVKSGSFPCWGRLAKAVMNFNRLSMLALREAFWASHLSCLDRSNLPYTCLTWKVRQ